MHNFIKQNNYLIKSYPKIGRLMVRFNTWYRKIGFMHHQIVEAIVAKISPLARVKL